MRLQLYVLEHVPQLNVLTEDSCRRSAVDVPCPLMVVERVPDRAPRLRQPTARKRLGGQTSVQKRADAPSPTRMVTEALNMASTARSGLEGSDVQAASG